MNKKKKKVMILSVLSAVILTTVAVAVAPGSESDPLISLGYLNGTWKNQLKTELHTEVNSEISSSVESAENQIEQSLENKINTMKEQLKGELGDDIYADAEKSIDEKLDSVKKSLNDEISAALTEKLIDEIYTMVLEKISPSGDLSSSAVRYETVTVNSGKELHFNGNCEVIMKNGNALLRIESNTSSAVRDDTENKYIQNGENIRKNHLITVSGGVGNVFVVTQNETQFMIRGVYKIVG